jgi:hypothetical protein
VPVQSAKALFWWFPSPADKSLLAWGDPC